MREEIPKEWQLTEDEIRFSKLFCVHGLKLNTTIPTAITNNDNNKRINITLIPYEEFMNNYNDELYINSEDMVICDTIAIIQSCNNNTLEIQILKTVIASLYFAERYKKSKLYSAECKKEDYVNCKAERYHDFLQNYSIDGFFTNQGIESASWYISIGKTAMCEDSFERWTTRVYGAYLAESYERRALLPYIVGGTIECDDDMRKSLHEMYSYINEGTKFGNKMKSVFRLYYELLCNFRNIDQEVITYCTIFEMLLLKKDEDCQRKKVAARSACIVCDGLDVKYKRFVADFVYHFYRYRNLIVHDGGGIMDIEDELLFNRSIWCMKSIIFCIVRYFIEHHVSDHSDIMQIVKNNVKADNLSEGFEYIDLKKFDNPDYKMNIIIEKY